jgi:hypothetical protein
VRIKKGWKLKVQPKVDGLNGLAVAVKGLGKGLDKI